MHRPAFMCAPVGGEELILLPVERQRLRERSKGERQVQCDVVPDRWLPACSHHLEDRGKTCGVHPPSTNRTRAIDPCMGSTQMLTGLALSRYALNYMQTLRCT